MQAFQGLSLTPGVPYFLVASSVLTSLGVGALQHEVELPELPAVPAAEEAAQEAAAEPVAEEAAPRRLEELVPAS